MKALFLQEVADARRPARTQAVQVLQACAAGAGISLLAWHPGHWLLALLLLPWLWSKSNSKLRAFALWGGYYLTTCRDIPVMCANFFTGSHEASHAAALAVGITAWIVSGALLSAPWALLAGGRGAKSLAAAAALATALVTAPPLGIIGWVSPIHVSSALYPGWGAMGLMLGLLVIACVATLKARGAQIVASVLGVLAAVANSVYDAPRAPSHWVGLTTHFGVQSDKDYAALYRRSLDVQKTVSEAFRGGAAVVVAPEAVAGPWRASSSFWWSSFADGLRANGKSLILGAEIPDQALLQQTGRLRYKDAVIALGASPTGQLDSRQPMPLGSWRPWADVTAVAGALSQPFLVIDGRRVAVSVCYEDMLWWPHWRAFVHPPDVIVSVANNWFIGGMASEVMQAQSIASIARLVGRPLVRALNE